MSEQGFKNIPGVPEGWELIGFRMVARDDYILSDQGCPRLWSERAGDRGGIYPIIRKIEKPKQYRPFANAEEFKPHRDRWWRWKEDPNYSHPPCCYSDKFHGRWAYDWSESFCEKMFDDGSPFGVEIT
ncbi:hypothetical protein EBR96_11205 [bacterium]|nr:hypothetical protein [bacterium]